MEANPTAANLNEFGRFDQLIDTVDKDQAQAFIEALEGEAVVRRRLNGKIYNVLRAFLIGNDESLVNIPSVGTTASMINYGPVNIGTNIERIVINIGQPGEPE